MRRLGSGIALLCLYVAVASWWLRPLSWELSDHVPGTPRFGPTPPASALGDIYLTLWILGSGSQRLLGDPARLFHPPAFYPERHALAFSDHMLGHQPLFHPVYSASANPVLALNVSLVASTALLAMGTHLLIRHWGGGFAAALLGASLAAAAPWRVGPATVRVHTLWVHYFPFILLFFDRYIGRRRKLDLGLAGSCLLLQILTSYYAGYAALIMVGVYLTRRLLDAPAAAARAGVCVLAVIACAAAASYPYLVIERSGTMHDPSAIFTSLATLGAPAVLTVHSIGSLCVALTLLLAIPLRQRSPGGGDRAPAGTLVAIAALGYLLAIGPAIDVPRSPREALSALWAMVSVPDHAALARTLAEARHDAVRVPMPYALLETTVPGFDRLRAPFRFGVLPATLLPITAALALGRLCLRLPFARGLPSVALALVVLSQIPPVIASPVEVGAKIPPAYRWLRVHGAGRPLLEVPNRRDFSGLYHECRAMYFATYHRLPLLNGYSGHVPETFRRRARTAARLPERDALRALCDETRLGWVLVHLDRLPPASRRAWRAPPPELLEAARFESDLLFRVSCPGAMPPPDADRRHPPGP